MKRYSYDKGVSLSNPIKCFVRFRDKKSEIIIYEEIFLSDKFPNKLPYSDTKEVSKNALFKISDLNKCLKVLNLKIK